MKIELYDEANKKQVLVADAEFMPLSVFVTKVCSIDEEYAKENNLVGKEGEELCLILTSLLSSRCEYICSREYDEMALKLLGLEEERSQFGRMCEYRAIVGLMNNFRTNYDSYAVYPLETQMVSYVAYDPSLCRIYTFKKREDENDFNA